MYVANRIIIEFISPLSFFADLFCIYFQYCTKAQYFKSHHPVDCNAVDVLLAADVCAQAHERVFAGVLVYVIIRTPFI